MAIFLLPSKGAVGSFSTGDVSRILRCVHEHGSYFADLAYFNSLRTERDRWKATTMTVLDAMEEVETAGKTKTVMDVFTKLLSLDKCQVWTADNVKNVLTLQAGQGGSRQRVTVSINGAGAVSKAARCGEVTTALNIGGDGVTEEVELIAPIMSREGRPLMVVQADRVRLHFSQLDLGIITMLQKFFTTAVEHAIVVSTVSTRTFDEQLMQSLTIEEAMKAVLQSASKLCRCHNALVYWPSPEGSMCQYYLENGHVKMKNYFTTMGIAASVIVEQKPLLLPNSREHPRFHSGLDGVELPIFKYGHSNDANNYDGINAAYLPIYDKDVTTPMAVLAVRDKQKRMAFTRMDLLSLNALTKQVAVALKNVEKHEGLLERARTRDIRHAQMSQLNSIRTMQIEAMSKIATRVPINTIAESMTRSMSMLLGVEFCKLHLVEERGTMVRSIGQNSLQDKTVEIAKASQSHVICRVIKSNEAVLIDLQTIQTDPSIKYEVDGKPIRNSLSVPLRTDSGQVFAVLQLVNKIDGTFTGSDELIVHMAGTAFETVIDAAQLSSVRFDIGLESIDHSPEDIVSLILEKTMQLVSADAGQVLQLVNERKSLRRVAEVTATGERVGSMTFVSKLADSDHSSVYDITQGIVGTVVQTKTTISVPNLRQDPRFDPAVDLKCDYKGHSSLLCAPLVSSMGQVMGAVEVVKTGIAQFNARELQLMDVLATQAGTLLHNRERHEVAVAKTVENIIAVTTSVMKCLEVQPSIDVIVNRIADRAVSVVPCENAVVLFRGTKKRSREFWTKMATRDEDTRRFVKKAGRTAFTGERAHRDIMIPISNGLISDCLTTKSSLDVASATGDQRVSHEIESLCATELKNLMVVPIFRNAKCPGIGMLVLMNKADGPFLPDDSRRLINFTEVISSAVENITKCSSWKLHSFLDAMVLGPGS